MQATLHETLALIVDAGDGPARLPADRQGANTSRRTAARRAEDRQRVQRAARAAGHSRARPQQREIVGRINNLVGKKLAELEATIALYEKDGAERRAGAARTPASASARWTRSAPRSTTWSRDPPPPARRGRRPLGRRHRVRPRRHAGDDRVHGRAAAGRVAARAARRAAARGSAALHAQEEQAAPGVGGRGAHGRSCPSCRTTCRPCARRRSRSSRATSTTSWAASS